MKKNEINWDHTGRTITESLGISEERAELLKEEILEIGEDSDTVSQGAEKLIEKYGDNPGELVYSLVILIDVLKVSAIKSVMEEKVSGLMAILESPELPQN